MNKDFRLILDMARTTEDGHMPPTEVAFQITNAALHSGGAEDFSAVMRHMETLNGDSPISDATGVGARKLPLSKTGLFG
jgi:hypothetical protein